MIPTILMHMCVFPFLLSYRVRQEIWKFCIMITGVLRVLFRKTKLNGLDLNSELLRD